MQYVNDDMDELMRRAAKEYPLNTQGADWGKVLHALQSGGGDPEPPKKGAGNKRYLWLLMLIPIGLVCNHIVSNKKNEEKPVATPRAMALPAKNNHDLFQAQQPGDGIRTEKTNDQSGHIRKQDHDVVRTHSNNSSSSTGNLVTENNSIKATNSARQAVAYSSFPSAPFFRVTITPSAIKTKTSFDLPKYPAGEKHDVPSTAGDTNQDFGFVGSAHPDTIRKKNLSGPVDVQASIRDTSERADLSIVSLSDSAGSAEPEKNNAAKTYRKKFYAGAFATIDGTSINLQKIQQGSIGYGIMLGYSHSNRWSVEASASTVKRYYYSDGKYLKTTHIYLPPNSSITEVKGNCRMTDISLAARYSFGRSRQWFGTGGISSYQMKSEQYDYVYYYPTSGSYVTRRRWYNETRNYMAAAVHLSAGYYVPLGKTAALRIEPYVKVPLKGMGVGSLPLTSGGLQVGVVKRLF
jgi:hypothetical protein